MSVFVSSYDKVFLDAFKGGIEQIPAEHEEAIKKSYQIIADAVFEKLEYYVQNEMKSNLDGEICAAASKVAESMLMDALAGEDKVLRNLFAFNEYYMKHRYGGDLPMQFKLIDMLVERKPDLFRDERIAQKDNEIDRLSAEVKRLNEYIDRARELRESF